MHDSEGDHYHIPCLEFGSYFTYIDVYLNDELLMEGDVGKYTPKIDDIHETKTIQVKDDEEKVISYDYTTRGYFTLDTTLCVERSITGQKVKGSFFKKETVTTYSHVAIPYKIVYYFDSTEICTKTGLIDLGDELVYDYTIDVDPSCESQLKHYVKEWQKWSKKKKRAQ